MPKYVGKKWWQLANYKAPTVTVLCTCSFVCTNVRTEPFYVQKYQCMQILNLSNPVLSHAQNFIWWVNCMPIFQQGCSVILLQMIHLQLQEWKWALQFLVDIDFRHCYIGQKLFCFKFRLFSLIVIHISHSYFSFLFLSNIKKIVLQFLFCINCQ